VWAHQVRQMTDPPPVDRLLRCSFRPGDATTQPVYITASHGETDKPKIIS
jgi:hypothetical protein